MQDYKDAVEHKKYELMKKKDEVLKERELRTSLNINSDEKIEKFKSYVN